jgi:Flp pilus assembly protein TadD
MAGGLFSIILTGWIFCSWASIYARKTDYELLRHALRYPTSSVVRGNLALLYLDNGLLDPAEKLADEAIAMNPLNNQVRMIKERITFLRQQNSRPNH